jgi:putative iron-dependent peroxidase
MSPEEQKVALQYHINRGYAPISRQGWPYHCLNDSGLLFLAFCRSLREFETVLNRMVGAKDGISDNLFKFSKAVEVNYYFNPSNHQLEKLSKSE